MPEHPSARADQVDIVIAGGGPVGLMLACELRLSGTDPIVLERLPGIDETPKGNGLAGQIVPVLDYRGLFDRLRQEATFAGPVPRFLFGPLELDFSRLGTSPVHILTVPQRRLEKVLEARLTELGGTVRRGHELTALSPHDDAVTLDVRGPGGDYRLRARYLVGCDGAHSLVRKQAGIGFPGTTSPEISRIGQVRLPTAKLTRRGGVVKVPGLGRLKLMGQVRTPRGTYSLAPLIVFDKNAAAGVFIVYTSEDDPTADLNAPMTLDELRASARRVLGGDLPMTDPQRLSQILKNLLANAFKFTDSGQVELTIDSARTGWSPETTSLAVARSVVAFTVRDTGIGIEKEQQQLMFEAFAQADGSPRAAMAGQGSACPAAAVWSDCWTARSPWPGSPRTRSRS